MSTVSKISGIADRSEWSPPRTGMYVAVTYNIVGPHVSLTIAI